MRAAVFVAVFLTAASVQAEESVSEPTVMVVEFPRGARFVGFPSRCPGATDDQEAEMCLAELYEGGAINIRHVAGPRIEHRFRLRLTAHARSWPPGTRMLVAVLPFEDRGVTGRFAYWWDLPAAGDAFCQTVEDLQRWPDGAVRQAFMRGFRRRFRPAGYVETADFRCIRG
jgi:hypothetical protein